MVGAPSRGPKSELEGLFPPRAEIFSKIEIEENRKKSI